MERAMLAIKRILDISTLISQRSLLFFGPRQAGKSFYIKHQLPEKPAKTYNLLDSSLLHRLMTQPSRIREELEGEDLRDCLVVIDEVQKCPQLLDEVQLLIEERGIRFLLTGSSARKMRSSSTNLLGGRARYRSFHPLVFPELNASPQGYNLERAMNHGLLPYHYLSKDPTEDLAAYVDKYLTEEIAAEGLSRNIPGFSRFLLVAALANAQLINYSGIASDAAINRQTVQSYFQILQDTLLGFQLEPFTTTIKRKAIATAKFYFFDPGIVKFLREMGPISEGSKDYGDFFEHLIFLELRTYLDYRAPRKKLNFWRSTAGHEVDFIFDKRIAIEVKATKRTSPADFKGLHALKEEGMMESYFLICREDELRLVNGITVYPWRRFLEDLWQDKFV
jgi:predicted AAA+ superfamily ATPase